MEGSSPPVALEAERALLGGLMIAPTRWSDVADLVTPEDFYRPDHGALFELLKKMLSGEDKDTVELMTVVDRVRREGRAERYGGVAYIADLPNEVPSDANLAHYARLVKEKAVARSVLKLGRHIQSRASSDPEDISELIADALNQLGVIGQTHQRTSWQPISELIDAEIIRLDSLKDMESRHTGYSTKFTELDAKLAGLQKTDLLILAARPGMGKTALALNIAQNVAKCEGRPVGIFSLEMSEAQIVNRLLCVEARVDASRMRKGELDTSDWTKLVKAENVLRQVKIHVDDTPGLSINDVRTRARVLKGNNPDLALIVIDYLQLMKGEDPRAPREQQISSISRGLKGLAKELECAVMALSQLNRGVESRADKRPLVSDLRESGAIEQDADVIMFIYRDEYYNKDTTEPNVAEVIIAKQRSGPTGTVRLAWAGKYTRFDNCIAEDITL